MASSLPFHSGDRWQLRSADTTVRLFLTLFLCTLTAGYLVGLLFVHHTTSSTPGGIAEQFRGSPESSSGPELKYAKSPDELYIFLHNHILSLSIVFALVGMLFYFTSIVRGKTKAFLMVEPFIAIGTTFGGIWLTQFVSEHFSWVVIISGASMACCYVAMVGLILWELWVPS